MYACSDGTLTILSRRELDELLSTGRTRNQLLLTLLPTKAKVYNYIV